MATAKTSVAAKKTPAKRAAGTKKTDAVPEALIHRFKRAISQADLVDLRRAYSNKLDRLTETEIIASDTADFIELRKSTIEGNRLLAGYLGDHLQRQIRADDIYMTQLAIDLETGSTKFYFGYRPGPNTPTLKYELTTIGLNHNTWMARLYSSIGSTDPNEAARRVELRRDALLG